MIRLLVADDHPVMREAVGYILALAPDIEMAGEASNGDEVMRHVRDGRFDLLLLDMNMPGVSGVDLIESIRQCRPTLPILVYTMHNDLQLAMRAIVAGASGLLTKDSDPELLLAAIRRVSSGERYLDPAVVGDMAPGGGSADSPHSLLSNREMEAFRLLAGGK